MDEEITRAEITQDIEKNEADYSMDWSCYIVAKVGRGYALETSCYGSFRYTTFDDIEEIVEYMYRELNPED